MLQILQRINKLQIKMICCTQLSTFRKSKKTLLYIGIIYYVYNNIFLMCIELEWCCLINPRHQFLRKWFVREFKGSFMFFYFHSFIHSTIYNNSWLNTWRKLNGNKRNFLFYAPSNELVYVLISFSLNVQTFMYNIFKIKLSIY